MRAPQQRQQRTSPARYIIFWGVGDKPEYDVFVTGTSTHSYATGSVTMTGIRCGTIPS